MLEKFVDDKINNNCIFEPIEPSFKFYFYPYGDKNQNDNYVQENLTRDEKTARLLIAFIEKHTKAPSSDGVSVKLLFKDIMRILEYLQDITNDNK